MSIEQAGLNHVLVRAGQSFVAASIGIAKFLKASIKLGEKTDFNDDSIRILISLPKFAAHMDEADKSGQMARLKEAGISYSDFLLWLALTNKVTDDVGLSVVDECIESKRAGGFDLIVGNLKMRIEREEMPLRDMPLSAIPHKPHISTNYELSVRIFSDLRGHDGEWIDLFYDKTYDGRPSARARIRLFNTGDLKLFDINVLATLVSGAMKNPYPDGGCGISWNQLHRAYFGQDSHDRVTDNGMKMLMESVERLRTSGFDGYDFSDLIEKGRGYASLQRSAEREPFLIAQTGSVRVSADKKDGYDEGIVILKYPRLFTIDQTANRIKDVSKTLRPKKLPRNPETEERYVTMLNALIQSTGRTNSTVYMFKQPTADDKPMAIKDGLLRDERFHPTGNGDDDTGDRVTLQNIRSACKWVEKTLEHWRNIGVCDYVIEYRKHRGKDTNYIERFRIFNAKKDKIFPPMKLAIPTSKIKTIK